MLEKFRDAALAKIKAEQDQTMLSLVQLQMPTMQAIGEGHVMLKAKYEGLKLAAELVEEAYQTAIGNEPVEGEKPAEGPYR